jgi:hypothetical protein
MAPQREMLAPPPTEPPTRGQRPTFSVIIAAYQASEFIGDAIGSILAQTLPPIEIIVCDDGSTDDLDAALAPYADQITLLRKENGGEASAKNMAMRAASCEFLAILDADDIYFPDRLEALAELSASRPDLDILTADCLVVANGRYIRNCYGGRYRFEVRDQRRGILERNFVGPGQMAVRRKALLAVGGFDQSFRHATDWDCWIRMIFSGSRVGLVNEPLAEYRVRATGLASSRTKQLEGYVAVLEKTTGRSDLSQVEREILERSLAAQRRRLAFHEAESAVLDGRPEARRLALGIALDSAFPRSMRVRAAAAAAAPGLAKRLAHGRRELAAGVRF